MADPWMHHHQQHLYTEEKCLLEEKEENLQEIWNAQVAALAAYQDHKRQVELWKEAAKVQKLAAKQSAMM